MKELSFHLDLKSSRFNVSAFNNDDDPITIMPKEMAYLLVKRPVSVIYTPVLKPHWANFLKLPKLSRINFCTLKKIDLK